MRKLLSWIGDWAREVEAPARSSAAAVRAAGWMRGVNMVSACLEGPGVGVGRERRRAVAGAPAREVAEVERHARGGGVLGARRRHPGGGGPPPLHLEGPPQ